MSLRQPIEIGLGRGDELRQNLMENGALVGHGWAYAVTIWVQRCINRTVLTSAFCTRMQYSVMA
jgi:hypothetical protein